MVSVLCRFPAFTPLLWELRATFFPGGHPFISLGPQVEPTSSCTSGSLSLTGGQSVPVSPVHLSHDTWFELLYLTSLLQIHKTAFCPAAIVTHSETEINQSEWNTSQLLGGCQFYLLMGLEEV